MIECSFFNSRSNKYAALTGVSTLLIGSGCSVAFAMCLASKCTHALNHVAAQVGTTVDIPKLTATISPRQHNTTVTLTDIIAIIPENFVDLLNHASSQASDYCFNISLMLGLFLTVCSALTLACVAFTRGTYLDQQEKQQHPYALMTA